MNEPHRLALRRLARFCGVKLDYWDLKGRHQFASEASLLGVLRALGVNLDGPADAAGTLTRLRLARWRCPLEPVTVAWLGRNNELRLRLPAERAEKPLQVRLRLAQGQEQVHQIDAGTLPIRRAATIAGERIMLKGWRLPPRLPRGYHRLAVEIDGREHVATLIRAPLRTWQPPATADGKRAWGVFLPLYALRTERGWGAGDWSDFGRLADWVHEQGGQVVATLPMLAGFLGNGPRGDEPGPFEASPYAPASRLFLNELFIDLEAAPEFGHCPEARALMASEDFQREDRALAAEPLVDYRRQMALKRRVLMLLARVDQPDHGGPDGNCERWSRTTPDALEYARFRAYSEQQGKPWMQWPEPQRSGRLEPSDVDPTLVRYHLYVQWLAERQMRVLGERTGRAGRGLYLDMPLGVGSDSYDVWSRRGLFALDAAGGAPPDDFFSKGQNWGFPPMHPWRSREEGHAYWIASVRRLMQTAGMLRIDHVMGLHRLFWIPRGMAATEGVYVRYPAEELHAVLALESQRWRVQVVGENLGTVPPSVNAAMTRHGVAGMYVLQFSVRADGDGAISPVPPGSVASLNTHDTPTFAGWWAGRDLDIQLEMGLLDHEGHRQAHLYRSHVRDSMIYFLRRRGLLGEDVSTAAMLAACLRWLAGGAAGLVLVNLEDLWLEPEPQNVPGTGPERPNWRRRAGPAFETWTNRPDWVRILQEIDELRRGSASRPG